MARLSLGAHPLMTRLAHSPVSPPSSRAFPFFARLLPAVPLRAPIPGATAAGLVPSPLHPPLPPSTPPPSQAVRCSQYKAAEKVSKSLFLHGEMHEVLPNWCYWPGSGTECPLGTCFSSITVDQLTWGSMRCRGKL